MGDYTELIFGADLKSDTPKEVIDTLRYMAGDTDTPPNKLCYSGDTPLLGSSYYFGVSKAVNKMWYDDVSDSWHISTRSNVKNRELIENFLKWIKPYISSGSGESDIYAIVIFEYDETPTLYYLSEFEKNEKAPQITSGK